MLSNYLKMALRRLLHQKGFSLISILGLSVGMACFILITMWVKDELSYDRFHMNAAQLFQIINFEKLPNGKILQRTCNPPELAPYLKRVYPEIQDTCRFVITEGRIVQNGERLFNEDGVACTESSFLHMFTFRFLQGDAEHSLNNPWSLVLTKKMAKKYFRNDNPIGKTLHLDNRFNFTVAAVIDDVPPNSHLKFDFLVPIQSVKERGWSIAGWDSLYLYTYVLLTPRSDYQKVIAKIHDILPKFNPDFKIELSLLPVTDIHLEGRRSTVNFFLVVAAFILFTACINYMNLATARAGKRAKEVGVRKVIGASRSRLILQFLGESLVTSLLAFGLSLLLVFLLLPLFNTYTAKQLSFSMLHQGMMIIFLLSTTIIVGLIAGFYPTLMISGFNTVLILKGSQFTSRGGALFRKVLVSFQFILTIALIFSSVVVNRQLNHIREQKLGFNKEQLLYLNLRGDSPQKGELLKNELSKIHGVLSVSAVSGLPTGSFTGVYVNDWEGNYGHGRFPINLLYTDCDFAKTLGVTLDSGRFFLSGSLSDKDRGVVLNESAIRTMEIHSPIGKKILGARIIGVFKDFNFQSLHSPVSPLAIFYNPAVSRYLLIKFTAGDTSNLLRSLEYRWRKTVANVPFDYQFLDERINTLYKGDRQTEAIVNSFTVLALFISCLGLLGMVAYTTKLRTKEICIRKISGSSILGIVILLLREHTQCIVLASIIAWPIAYFIMHLWLQDFAYRINIGFELFLISSLVALLVALLTISHQSIRAAMANPIEYLRYE